MSDFMPGFKPEFMPYYKPYFKTDCYRDIDGDLICNFHGYVERDFERYVKLDIKRDLPGVQARHPDRH